MIMHALQGALADPKDLVPIVLYAPHLVSSENIWSVFFSNSKCGCGC